MSKCAYSQCEKEFTPTRKHPPQVCCPETNHGRLRTYEARAWANTRKLLEKRLATAFKNQGVGK